MSGSRQYKGVTEPLSDKVATPTETKATTALIDELKRQNNFESPAETQKRDEVLASLNTIAKEFVRVVLKSQGYSDAVAKASGGKVFTYGSYRLGVFGPGSDIDTLVVGPKYVTHEHFFKYFPDLLVKMAPAGAITNLSSVPDAFVPIIKFEYSGVDIDLIYSRIKKEQIPDNLTLLDTKLLQGLDDTELRSLNGTRVTDEILELIPQPVVFRTALRAIKLWAQRRAVYANIMGFPGGVAWAMLLARVCQLYPNATASIVVLKFFHVMERWQWPQPVLLKQLEPSGPIEARVWNPQIYPRDRFHLMPIITPAFPSMCATHNISQSTKTIILQELKRGGEIAGQIIAGQLPWKELFGKHTFFTQGYKYYLSVISASTTKDAQMIWAGMVESKVRLLVQQLETVEHIEYAHPFNKGFERAHRCRTEEDIHQVKEGSLDFQAKDIATSTTGHGPVPEAVLKAEQAQDEKNADDADVTMVYTTTHYVGLSLIEGATSLDLAAAVDEFKKICTTWDKYNAEMNYLHVIRTKNTDLPDDVFSEGETKPTRPQKKKNKKRAAEDTNGSKPKRQQNSVAATG